MRTYNRGRGLKNYGKPFKDSYGSQIEVSDSSSAEGRFIWLRIDGGGIEGNKGRAHLNRKQAKAIIDRLQAWMDSE